MGLAIEVLSGRATNPGATGTAATVGSGDSFGVRSFPMGSAAYLENVWVQGATAGFVRVRSARLHDNVKNLQLRSIAATPRALLGDEQRQRPQDYDDDIATIEYEREEHRIERERHRTFAYCKCREPRVRNEIREQPDHLG